MFRFTTRELVLMTIIVGLGLAWLIQTAERGRAEERAMRDGDRLEWLTGRLEASGYRVVYTDDPLTGWFIDPPLSPATGNAPIKLAE